MITRYLKLIAQWYTDMKYNIKKFEAAIKFMVAASASLVIMACSSKTSASSVANFFVAPDIPFIATPNEQVPVAYDSQESSSDKHPMAVQYD